MSNEKENHFTILFTKTAAVLELSWNAEIAMKVHEGSDPTLMFVLLLWYEVS